MMKTIKFKKPVKKGWVKIASALREEIIGVVSCNGNVYAATKKNIYILIEEG